MAAAFEITENMQSLEILAPSDLDNLSLQSCQALREFNRVNSGLISAVATTGKGYVLLAKWMEAIHDYANHTGQLSAQPDLAVDDTNINADATNT